jgi:hypothetical protein
LENPAALLVKPFPASVYLLPLPLFNIRQGNGGRGFTKLKFKIMFKIKRVKGSVDNSLKSVEIHTERQSVLNRLLKSIKSVFKRGGLRATVTELDSLGRVSRKKSIRIPFIKNRGEGLIAHPILGNQKGLMIKPPTEKFSKYFIEIKGYRYEIKYHGEIYGTMGR